MCEAVKVAVKDVEIRSCANNFSQGSFSRVGLAAADSPTKIVLQLPNRFPAYDCSSADMETTLPALLDSLKVSLDAATNSVPEESNILPPKDGISLLDIKNELFLSYLQNLVFLIIIKLRHASAPEDSENTREGLTRTHEEVVKKLAELRVYLEKGVRPLEGRLKYQIDKVVRAAEDADRATKVKAAKANGSNVTLARTTGKTGENGDGDSEDEEGDSSEASADIDELSYRPNPSAMLQTVASSAGKKDEDGTRRDGIYRPPQITPTVMPVTRGRVEREDRRPAKSATLDEFIATELSVAPIAEPSIGSTIISGGRRNRTARERDGENERRLYEEAHFVRLPTDTKNNGAKKGGRPHDGGFGGEEWRNLDMGLDRIEKLTRKKAENSGGLAKSRKRAVEDGPRNSGEQAGTRFANRLRAVRRRLK